MTTTPRTRSFRALLAAGLAALLAITTLSTVDASSHREAPLIAEDPVADNTDTYAFVSPANPDNTVLIANYIPLQDADAGPNFHNFGDDVLYEINVDNDGDAVADVTFEFDFTTTLTDPNSFLYAFGPITALEGEGAAAWNLRQSYDLSVVQDGVRTVLGQDLVVPPNNLGPRSTPNYAALSDAAIQSIDVDGGTLQAFAGQKDDPFWVDLGSVFDLGTLRPFEGLHLVGNDSPTESAIDSVAGRNTHSIAVEVPSSYLGATEDQPVVGVWATASRRQTRTFSAGNSADPIYTGPYRQVSRLGMPLVNEAVIPLGLKDTFNTLSPSQDAGALAGVTIERASGANSDEGAVPVVTDPELLDLFPVLYPDAFDTDGEDGPDEGAFTHYSAEAVSAAVGDEVGRVDLSAIYLTGVGITAEGEPCLDSTADDCDNVNQIPGGVPAEMIRLNTAVPPSSSNPNDVNRLGVLGGDNGTDFLGEGAEADGFPNGRRLYDDVTDITLLALAGATVPGVDPATVAPLSDGTLTNDLPFLDTFPYLAQPHSGYYSPQEDPLGNNL
ncbi:DUF4331 domain-containing protein [Euzebya tangerina]|uniref:DUF4331 domain-containing protein n=1 Tax=Euzebya tangerina TaxID=591198 RepID=UPI000E31498B|nr:DUF4331 domain-containing protein [Euzebya tangerina]